jgi:hypothetical protein
MNRGVHRDRREVQKKKENIKKITINFSNSPRALRLNLNGKKGGNYGTAL